MEKGILRSRDINMMLASCIKEWTEYLKLFDNIHTNQGVIDQEGNVLQKWHFVTANYYSGFAFKAYLGFVFDENSRKLCLKIKSVLIVDPESIIKGIKEDDDRLYIWSEYESFYEPEIIEKDYVIGLINSRIIRFNENFKQF